MISSLNGLVTLTPAKFSVRIAAIAAPMSAGWKTNQR